MIPVLPAAEVRAAIAVEDWDRAASLLQDHGEAVAAAREISLAELVRNGLEYMLRVSAGAEADAASDGDRERVSFAVLYFRFR